MRRPPAHPDPPGARRRPAPRHRNTRHRRRRDGGLLHLGAGAVRFRHPLVRSAVYDSAPFSERARVHQAAALAGPDDAVAGALEESACRSMSRSGFAATSALRRASSLTTEPRVRARRLASTASLSHEARELPVGPKVLADLDYALGLAEITDATAADACLRLTRAAEAIASADPARAPRPPGRAE